MRPQRPPPPAASPATPAIPIVFAQTYLDVVAAHGGPVREVLRQADLSERELKDASALDHPRYERLVHAVRASLGPAVSIGVEQGWRLPPTSFGPLGLAVLSSATLRDALDLCQRFWPMYGMGLTLCLRQADGVCVLEFSTLPLMVAEVDRATVLEAVIASLYRSATVLLPELAPSCEVWFEQPTPPYAAHVAGRLPQVRWGMPANQMRFAAHQLAAPMPMANAVNLRTAVAACEQALARHVDAAHSLANRVLQALALDGQGYPGAAAVARQLAMSERTLRRRLQAEGVSFLDLRHQARMRDAKTLLLAQRPPHAVLAIQEIAQRLGYGDPANFTRAFRQWTGVAPSVFRARGAGDPAWNQDA